MSGSAQAIHPVAVNAAEGSAVDRQVQQCQRLAGVLTTTQQMLACAEDGDWEQVADLERRRRDDLAACFAQPVTIADSSLIAEALAALLSLNEELMARLNSAKSEVMDSGIQFSRNREAVNSYSAVQVTR
ncbi:MAG: flagellar protein FliT [Halioglobus sp.]|nr:flagellar protein FliT [Halioglobus sp.]